MNNQKISDGKHQRRYAEAIRQARLAGMYSFQSWFNKSKDMNQLLVRGYWDLTFNILTPKVYEYIENPEEKIALEIGYGGENPQCSM